MSEVMTGSAILARELSRVGVEVAFVFQGGAISSAIDEFAAAGIRLVPFDHELDAAYAAEGFVRSSGKLACVLTTSGPGATNLISGLCGSWFDGIPVLFVTGQVRASERTDFDWNLQSGFQEVDIVPMVRGITKYARRVYHPGQVAFATQAAVRSMLRGRRGPALLDLTMNAQMDSTHHQTVTSYSQSPADTRGGLEPLHMFFEALESADQPLLLVGGGFQWQDRRRVRSALESLGIPVIATYGGVNVLPLDHHLNLGFIGPFGHPSANKAFIEATHLFVIGARIPTRALPPMEEACAEQIRHRPTFVITTDPEEFATHPLSPEFVTEADVADFVSLVEEGVRPAKSDVGRDRRGKKNLIPAAFFQETFAPSEYSPRDLVGALNHALKPETRIFVDVGQNAVALALGLERADEQLLFSSWANSPMGYSLPAAIGASFDESSPPPVCVIGDGGLRTALSSLPNLLSASGRMKTIVWDNGGYATIIDHLQRMLEGRLTAVDSGSGLPEFPIREVLIASGLQVSVAEGDLSRCVAKFLNGSDEDVLLVSVDPRYRLFPLPRVS